MYKFVMGTIGTSELIILSLNDNLISHAEMAQIYLRDFTLDYAGFVSFGKDGEVNAYGKSISLDIGTDGLDQDYFKQYVDFSICAQDIVPVPVWSKNMRTCFILAMGFKGSAIPEDWKRVAEHKDVVTFLNEFYMKNTQ